ncbi:hypothetical protein FACS18942_01680 [Planctomycetales bacterium]|nr:hypothetical protein FACS18942_01680 [Planctomycetales bacterium]
MMLFVSAVSASETSDAFNSFLPKIASENQDEKRDAQQGLMNLVLQKNDPALQKEILELMTAQVQKENPVETSVWLIRQIGYVGNNSVLPVLGKLAASSEKRIADESARAISFIPGDASAALLQSLNSQLAKDALQEHNADRDIRKKNENETKMPFAISYSSDAAAAEYLKGYSQFDNITKSQVLAGLKVRGDKKYVKYALDELKNGDEFIQKNAVAAVAAIGGSDYLPQLLEAAYSEKTGEIAKQAIVRINDSKLDSALLDSIKSEKNFGRFVVIADILKQRWNRDVLAPVLAKAVSSEELAPQERVQLLRIAEDLSTKDNLGNYVLAWELITDRGQRDQAEQVIARVSSDDAQPVLEMRNEKNYYAFFSLLGRISDEKTLPEVREKLSSDKEHRSDILRELTNWADGRVIDDLLKIAGNEDFTANDRISALRAFARVASLPNEQIKIKAGDREKVVFLEKGMALATRNDEKNLILQRAGQVRCLESLKFIVKYYDDTALRHQVFWSIIDLAHHNNLRNQDKKLFAEWLDKVIAESKDQNQLNRARTYREGL